MRLDCGCCVLRPWREGDEPSLVCHANNFEVWRRLRDRFPHPYTYADAEQWIAIVQRQDPQTHFAIEVHGEATGGIGLELGAISSAVRRRSVTGSEKPSGERDHHRCCTGRERLRVRSVESHAHLRRSFCEQFCVDTRPVEMRLHPRGDNAPECDQRGYRTQPSPLRPD